MHRKSELRNRYAQLTDWGEVLGGRLRGCLPSDIDGIMERNGYTVFLEAKKPQEKLCKSQAITLNSMLRTGTASCLVVTIDERNRVSHLWGQWCWGTQMNEAANNEWLAYYLSQWMDWASRRQPLPDRRRDKAFHFTERFL